MKTCYTPTFKGGVACLQTLLGYMTQQLESSKFGELHFKRGYPYNENLIAPATLFGGASVCLWGRKLVLINETMTVAYSYIVIETIVTPFAGPMEEWSGYPAHQISTSTTFTNIRTVNSHITSHLGRHSKAFINNNLIDSLRNRVTALKRGGNEGILHYIIFFNSS